MMKEPHSYSNGRSRDAMAPTQQLNEGSADGRRQVVRVFQVMVFGPPVLLLVAGLVGSAYGYAIFAAIRSFFWGEPVPSELTE